MNRITLYSLMILTAVIQVEQFGISEIFAAPTLPGNSVATQIPDTKAKIVHRAEYVDDKGNSLVVTTFSDGTITVSINNSAPIFGEEAVTVLAAHGIRLTLDDGGMSTWQKKSDKTDAEPEAQEAMPSGAVTSEPAASESPVSDSTASGSSVSDKERRPSSSEHPEPERTKPVPPFEPLTLPSLPVNATPSTGHIFSPLLPSYPPEFNSETYLDEKPVSK